MSFIPLHLSATLHQTTWLSNVGTYWAWFACDPLSWTSLYCTCFVWYRHRFFTVRLFHFCFYSMGLVSAKNFPWPFPWFIAVVTAFCAFRPIAGLPPGRKYSTMNLSMISLASFKVFESHLGDWRIKGRNEKCSKFLHDYDQTVCSLPTKTNTTLRF